MIKTKLNDMLGIQTPILGGTMMDLSMAPFVSAISEAGALGIIASAIYRDYDAFRNDLKAVKDKTGNPFAVNINLFPMMEKLDNFKYLEIMAEEGVRIVETSGFAPPEDVIVSLPAVILSIAKWPSRATSKGVGFIVPSPSLRSRGAREASELCPL